MAKIPVAGWNEEAMTTAGTDVRSIFTDPAGADPDFDGTGRVFMMKNLVVTNTHASQTATFTVYDLDDAGTGSATNTVLTILVPPSDTIMLSWQDAGPLFRVCCSGAVTN